MGIGLAMGSSAAGLVLFSKIDTLLPFVAVIAGVLASRQGPRLAVAPLGLVAVLLFGPLGAATTYARYRLGDAGSLSVTERAGALLDGALMEQGSREAVSYSSWGRINYLPSQIAAVRLYDQGLGGDDATRMHWAFIPRFVAPEKPDMTGEGRELYFKISGGYTGSSTGVGAFVDGYYNDGWIGVFVFSALVGVVIGLTSVVARDVVARRAVLLYPLAFFGAVVGLRIDGNFLGDYFGPLGMVVYPVALLAVVFPRAPSSGAALHARG
jgi:hypothetical protein